MNKQEASDRIGRNVRAVRERRGLTVAELADRAARTTDTVQKVEKGERMPKMLTLWFLAAALEVEPATLLEGVEWTPGEESG